MRTHDENQVIHDPFNTWEKMSADEKNRYIAERREQSRINKIIELGAARRKGRMEGRREGRKEEKEATAMNMIALGSFSMEQITQVTGLSVDEVKRLQNTREAEAA